MNLQLPSPTKTTSSKPMQSSLFHEQRPRELVLADFDCYLCKCRWYEDRHYFVPVGSLYFHNHHLQCKTLSTKGSSCQLLLLIYTPVKDTFSYIFALQGHLDQTQMQGGALPLSRRPFSIRRKQGTATSFAVLKNEHSGSSPSHEVPSPCSSRSEIYIQIVWQASS